MKQELLSPKIDVVFKALFGKEENSWLLLSLLNAVMSRTDGELLTDLQLRNPELPLNRVDGKSVILDVQARDQLGRYFDIEIQCQNHPSFPERLVYYWSRLCAEQLGSGKGYDELRQVISVVFADFRLFDKLNEYHTCWMWKEVEWNTLLTELGQIHIIELPKFQGEAESDALERWIQFLKKGETMTDDQFEYWDDPALKKAYEELQQISHDPTMRQEYNARLIWLTDRITERKYAYKEGREEGLEKGREEGLEKGREEGREEGLEKGREEGVRLGMAESAQKLLSRGMANDEVAELLGLTSEELSSLLQLLDTSS